MLKKTIGPAVVIVLIGLAAAGTFWIGLLLSPGRMTGQNLYRPHGSLMPIHMAADAVIIPASYAVPQRSSSQSANATTASRLALPQGQVQTASTRVVSDATDADSASDSEDINADGPGATFQQVYILLKHNYVDGVPDDSKLGHGAADAMLASLQDPLCRFMEPAVMHEMSDEEKGTFHGIGAITEVRLVQHGDPDSETNPGYLEYRLTVIDALPGSPAEKAGLKPGDVITYINTHWVAGYNPADARFPDLKAAQDDPVTYNKIVADIQKQVDTSIDMSQALELLEHASTPADFADGKGTPPPPTESLDLVVERDGVAKPLTVTVPADQTTQVEPVTGHILSDGIGYVKITQLSDDTDKTLDTVIASLGSDLKGLVVDLRDSPGGKLDVAADVAGKLIGAKYLGIVDMKGNKERQIEVSTAREVTCPISVIVDDGTANTSELLAAALHDSGCKLIGERTCGDGMDVASVPLQDGSGFTMTVGKYFTLSHKPFQTTGLAPDVVVPETGGPSDPQLMQAVASLSGRVAEAVIER